MHLNLYIRHVTESVLEIPAVSWRFQTVVFVAFVTACTTLRRVTISVVMPSLSFCSSAWNNSAPPTGRNFTRFLIRVSLKKIQFALKSDKHNGTLYEDRLTFLIISRSVLLRMRNVTGKKNL
jgi:hypothetical protein